MRKKLNIDKIHQAFSPTHEILDPKMFAGRHMQISNCIKALADLGSFLVIYGLRGVGKSSIARQVKLIAEGDNTVPESHKLEHLIPQKKFNYLVYYYQSDKFVKDIPTLFEQLMHGDEENEGLISLTKAGNQGEKGFKRKTSLGVKAGIQLGIVELTADVRSDTDKEAASNNITSLVSNFRTLLRNVVEDNPKKHDGILILIDEFDLIPDKKGFASIVKACSSEKIKFGIVGIANDINELIDNHGSITRISKYIHVPIMPQVDQIAILKKAMYRMDNHILFEQDAMEELCSKSCGFPYFIHLIGKEVALSAFERKAKRIKKSDIEAVYNSLCDGELSISYDAIYHNAVKNSRQREILIKLFADELKNEISTATIYPTAKELDVSNPSQLMQVLTTTNRSNSEPVLVKVRDGYYRFSDPVFKTYVRIRNWKYKD